MAKVENNMDDEINIVIDRTTVKNYVIKELDNLFPDKGVLYEAELYKAVKAKFPDKGGWDFHCFRVEYKNLFCALLETLELKNSTLKLKLKNSEVFSEIINGDPRMWEDKWSIYEDKPGEDEQELREGTFSCGNCRRRGMYARNTSHYEKQTRSADEPMTIFVHCYTCGKDSRFSQ